MCIISLEIYQACFRFYRGNKVLYAQALNYIYGTLKEALLFYKILSKDIGKKCFTINPYDICVANKIINGNQMTVVCNLDDMNIPHKIPQDISMFIENLKEKIPR